MNATDALASLAAQAERHQTAGGVVWHGWGEGPPIVLLHGAAGSWRHWLRTIPPLAARHRVLCPDMPGYGESAVPPAPVTLESYAAPLVAGIEALIPGAPFALAGFSLGATIAGQVAHGMGGRVARLILVGAGGLTAANLVEMERVRDKQGEARIEAHRENLRRIMIHDEGLIDALALDIQAWNSDHARLRLRGVLPPLTLKRLLPGIAAPLAAIWGEHDQPARGSLAERVETLRAIRPDARITLIPDAGHWVAHEAAGALTAAIEAALRG